MAAPVNVHEAKDPPVAAHRSGRSREEIVISRAGKPARSVRRA